jgi:hypothetical protein
MGSSGMKRKGRKHLPKVGTRPSIDYGVQEHRERVLDPFATDPSRRRLTLGTVLIALAILALIVIGVIALLVVTT